jgi:hypothetical protein
MIPTFFVIALVLAAFALLLVRRAKRGNARVPHRQRFADDNTHDDLHLHRNNADLTTGAVVGGVVLHEAMQSQPDSSGWGEMGSSGGSYDGGSFDGGSSSID